jgi:hypothetical protein
MSFEDWLSGQESWTGPFRVIQRWGPNLARHSTVLSEYSKRAAAFADMDQRVAIHVEAGAVAEALQLLVIDGDGRPVERPS